MREEKQRWQLDLQRFPFRGHDLPYYTVFDVIGWVLSILAPAPDGATLENYYAPLLALYSTTNGVN